MAHKEANQARELIDLLADAMDGHKDPKDQYRVGREILLGYYSMHPKAIFAVSQASKYLIHRVRVAA